MKLSPVFGGSMLVAGTAIGAGMLGLPMISAGMWFCWSCVVLLVSWFCMYRSSQAILEVNLEFEPGNSFHTLVKNLLGPFWSAVNGLAVAFVLYTLVYAYVSGGGSVLQHSLTPVLGNEPPRFLTSLVFSLLLAGCIWWSSRTVDRFSAILMCGMVLTFVLSVGGMAANLRPGLILGESGSPVFIWCAVSTYLTSFCFHASVPSLVKYLGKDSKTVNKSLLYGTLMALCCYFVWIFAADGTIPRQEFKIVIAEGGNVGNLLKAAGANIGNSLTGTLLDAFSLLAVATSFLGAGLGLFDYMADLCDFDDTRLGRGKTMLASFLPPMACGLLWPDGFLAAIGWAGLCAAIWSVIVPALLLRAKRARFAQRGYQAPGGVALVPLLLAYGLLVGVCHVLFVFELLPMYQ